MNYKEQAGKWMVSDTEEYWNEIEFFDTPDEAVKYGREIYEDKDSDDVFFIGRVKPQGIMAHLLGEYVLESIVSSHLDEHGEFAENYLRDVKKEHTKILDQRLEEVLKNWAEEFGYQPNYFMVENIQEVKIWDGEE
jgi:hypothetical protein